MALYSLKWNDKLNSHAHTGWNKHKHIKWVIHQDEKNCKMKTKTDTGEYGEYGN